MGTWARGHMVTYVHMVTCLHGHMVTWLHGHVSIHANERKHEIEHTFAPALMDDIKRVDGVEHWQVHFEPAKNNCVNMNMYMHIDADARTCASSC